MPQENEAARLARTWIEGWIAGEPDAIPLAAQHVMQLRIVKVLHGAGEACIWFDMDTPGGTVPCCDWVTPRDGDIRAVRSIYEATGLR